MISYTRRRWWQWRSSSHCRVISPSLAFGTKCCWTERCRNNNGGCESYARRSGWRITIIAVQQSSLDRPRPIGGTRVADDAAFHARTAHVIPRPRYFKTRARTHDTPSSTRRHGGPRHGRFLFLDASSQLPRRAPPHTDLSRPGSRRDAIADV